MFKLLIINSNEEIFKTVDKIKSIYCLILISIWVIPLLSPHLLVGGFANLTAISGLKIHFLRSSGTAALDFS